VTPSSVSGWAVIVAGSASRSIGTISRGLFDRTVSNHAGGNSHANAAGGAG
jgi:hypothetical protein